MAPRRAARRRGAAVYAATHPNGSRAAIMVLHLEVAADGHIRQRCFREGRVANSIEHDGAVKVLDEDEDEGGAVYLVMELLDGESLDARAARSGGKLPIDESAVKPRETRRDAQYAARGVG